MYTTSYTSSCACICIIHVYSTVYTYHTIHRVHVYVSYDVHTTMDTLSRIHHRVYMIWSTTSSIISSRYIISNTHPRVHVYVSYTCTVLCILQQTTHCVHVYVSTTVYSTMYIIIKGYRVSSIHGIRDPVTVYHGVYYGIYYVPITSINDVHNGIRPLGIYNNTHPRRDACIYHIPYHPPIERDTRVSIIPLIYKEEWDPHHHIYHGIRSRWHD